VARQFTRGVVLGAAVSAGVFIAGTAVAGTGVGAVFNLGRTNSVNASSTLKGATSGKTLQLTNTGSGGGLGVTVGKGKAPISVNAGAGKATNLNADKLDGINSTGFVAASTIRRFPLVTVAASASPGVYHTIGAAGPFTFEVECFSTNMEQDVILYISSSEAHAAYTDTSKDYYDTDMAASTRDQIGVVSPPPGTEDLVSETGVAITPTGSTYSYSLVLGQNSAGSSGGACVSGGTVVVA
jgi:hypothetical protein